MNGKWRAMVGAGAILALVSSQAMAQPWGGGPGRGRGFGRGPGQGLGWTSDTPGPMQRGMGPGGPQGGPGGWQRFGAGRRGPGMGPVGPQAGPGAWCPYGAGQRGPGYGRGPGMGMGSRAGGPGAMRQGMGPVGPQRGAGAWRTGADQRGRGWRAAPGWGQTEFGPLFAHRLDLTEDQAQKIRDIVAEGRTRTLASIKEVLTDEQIKQLEQMRDRAAQRGWGIKGRAEQVEPRGPASGRVGIVPPSRPQREPVPAVPEETRGTGFQRGQGRGAQMGPRGQGPVGTPLAGGPGAGRGGPPQRGLDRPDPARQPPAGAPATNPGPLWNRGGPPLEQWFEQADTDGDGALTREELRAFHQTRGMGPGRQRE